MRIAIMGAGGVGSYFGARLAASGANVTFVARGAHLSVLQDHGMSLKSPHGDLVLDEVNATDDPSALGPVDVVLLTVKLYDLEAACAAIAPAIGPETMVVPIQNGVSAVEMVCAHIDRRNVVGGLVFIASFVVAPGKVIHRSGVHRLVFGELDGSLSDRVVALRDAGLAAGFDAVASQAIEKDLWAKFVLLGGFGPLSALSRQPIGPVLADPDLRRLYGQSIGEVVEVARAKGIDLAPDIVEEVFRMSESFEPESKASMLEDLEAGKPLEIEWISGTLVTLGRGLGVPTPFHEIAYAAIKPFAMGSRNT